MSIQAYYEGEVQQTTLGWRWHAIDEEGKVAIVDSVFYPTGSEAAAAFRRWGERQFSSPVALKDCRREHWF
ncbi:MAG: hypothetical protein V4696_03820 [Pseudomonadota bacterium]